MYRHTKLVHWFAVILLLVTLAGAPAASARANPPGSIAASRLSQAPFTSCAAVTEIPQVECEALVALYNSTNGAGWWNYTNWLATDTPCSWSGVSCSAGHVGSLYLNSNQLTGSLPPELGNLYELISMDLASNQLTGSLPPELGNLNKLKYLYLRNNRLTGSIPAQIGNLTALVNLTLDQNPLQGEFPATIVNLSNLTTLTFPCQITSTDPAVIAFVTKFSPYFQTTRCTLSTNDDFDSPVTFSALPYDSGRQSPAFATLAPDDPALPCYTGQVYHSVWFRFTPSFPGSILVDATGSNYSSRLAAWTGGRGDLSNLGCAINELVLSVSAGTTYYFEVVSQYNEFDPLLVLRVSQALTISGSTGMPDVNLTAYTDDGYKFTRSDANGNYTIAVPLGWSGEVEPYLWGYSFMPPTRTYTDLQTNLEHEDYAPLSYNLSVSKTGAGSGLVTSSPGGILCGADCTQDYIYNTLKGVHLVLTASPEAGSIFTGWSGGCAGSGACQVNLTADTAVTANFDPGTSYTLSVTKTGFGFGAVTSSPPGIACGDACSSAFPPGTLVDLTIEYVSQGSTFTGWSGWGCSGTGMCTVTMESPKTILAGFNGDYPRLFLPLIWR
jgi:hypothetical protein